MTLPRELIDAIIHTESRGNARARSEAGAVGLMQLLPTTAQSMARRAGMPWDPRRLTEAEYNERLGTEYLEMLADRYGGDLRLAVTAYHAGEGNVDKWLRNYGDPRSGNVSFDEWLANVEAAGNPRSAQYPRLVFGQLGETPETVTPARRPGQDNADGGGSEAGQSRRAMERTGIIALMGDERSKRRSHPLASLPPHLSAWIKDPLVRQMLGLPPLEDHIRS